LFGKFRNYAKSYKFQEKTALPFVFEKNVGKALTSVEDLEPESAPKKVDFEGVGEMWDQ